MNKEELAAKLNGREYPFRMTTGERVQAKDDGLVVIYGASDDLMEFRGTIDEEIGAYNGTTTVIDTEGIQENWSYLIEGETDEKVFEEYFRRKGKGKAITACWCTMGDYSWAYTTAIPHATFDIMEGDEKYCRGIVISVEDLR